MTSSSTPPKISVVIPFFNEGENVDRLVEELHQGHGVLPLALASRPGGRRER